MAIQLELRPAPEASTLETRPAGDTPLARTLQAQGRRASWVAARLGVHRNTMSRWVNGREPIPRARIAQLAHLLDERSKTPNLQVRPSGEVARPCRRRRRAHG